MDDIQRKNNALSTNTNTVNGRTADIAITTRGSDLYFAISAAMAFTGFLFLLLAYTKPRRDRIFHYISAGIVFVASIAYFTMGSNLGFTPIAVEFPRRRPVVRGRFREIFYVRYIDWFITTPLLLVDLLLTAGLPWPKILWVVLVDWIMIVCGLVGALIRSRYKWAYFAVGCFALLYILYELLWTARRHARLLGSDIHRAFLACGCLTILLWILYPIAWGLCEGGNYISPDSEAIFYSVLDFLAKIGFGALLLWSHRNIDPARLGVQIRDYDEDPAVYAGLHGTVPQGDGEKGLAPGAAGASASANSASQVNGSGQGQGKSRGTGKTDGTGAGLSKTTTNYSAPLGRPPTKQTDKSGGAPATSGDASAPTSAPSRPARLESTTTPSTWAQIAAKPPRTPVPPDFPPGSKPKSPVPPDFPPGSKPAPKPTVPDTPADSQGTTPAPTPREIPGAGPAAPARNTSINSATRSSHIPPPKVKVSHDDSGAVIVPESSARGRTGTRGEGDAAETGNGTVTGTSLDEEGVLLATHGASGSGHHAI